MTAAAFQSRPMAMGRNGAVSAPHVLASQAAIEVLRAGGNAADAAVAAAAVATVVQPFSSSVAGVGWATVYDAATRSCRSLHFHGVAPAGLDTTLFRANPAGLVDWRALEAEGRAILGTLVPGAVAGWEALLAGAGTWTLDRVLEPAISLAVNGFPVSELLHEMLVTSASRLRAWPASVQIFLPGGRVPGPGELLVQRDLARTLRAIAANGAAELATGATGRAIAEFFAAHGGAITGDDLVGYRAAWHPATQTTFRGRTVHATAGPLGDVSFASGLQVLDAFGPFAGPLDPAYVDVSARSASLVGVDRRRLGPGVDASAIAAILGPQHTAELVAGARSFAPASGGGDPAPRPVEDTITLAVVDAEGNAVHLMQTVGTLFGTAAVIGDTGMLANSSLYFAYVDGVGENRIVPGEGVEQNPCLAIVCDADGKLELVIGSPGGKARVETVRQMLVDVVDFGLNVQQAVDAPRFLVAPDGGSVQFESLYGAVPAALRAALESAGHTVTLTDELFGSGQAIAIDAATGTRLAAADWRRESSALAW